MTVRRTGPSETGSSLGIRSEDKSRGEPQRVGSASRELAGNDLLRETTALADRLKVKADEVAAKVATVSDTVTRKGMTGSVGAVLGHILETVPSGEARADAISDIGEQTSNRLARAGIDPNRARQIYNEMLNAIPKDAAAPTVEVIANARLKELLDREFAEKAGSEVAADLVDRFGMSSVKRMLDGAGYIVPGHNPLARLVLSFTQIALSGIGRRPP